MVVPHEHAHVLATLHGAGAAEVAKAIEAGQKAYPDWSRMAFEDRAAIFLKAADLLAGPYRAVLNGATMLGQSKTVHQAEIDAACEMIDFFRFNVHFAQEIYRQQPASSPGCWNFMEYRPLEGFVFAVTPFNFTSIAGNLPTAPAILGNTVLWKPASSAVYSAHFIMDLLEEAGLPRACHDSRARRRDRVSAREPGSRQRPLHGSTAVFPGMETIGGTSAASGATRASSARRSRTSSSLTRRPTSPRWPRRSAGARSVPGTSAPRPRARSSAVALARVKRRLLGRSRRSGCRRLRRFMGAVIDKSLRHDPRLHRAREASGDAGSCAAEDGRPEGLLNRPTVVLAKSPELKLCAGRSSGPSSPSSCTGTPSSNPRFETCERGSAYALTGAVFARDRKAIAAISATLAHAAGNFYINDKPTGAVVGQQPFGGARASGTNDKAGSILNLIRWTSPRSIKETFVPPTHFSYPFLASGD